MKYREGFVSNSSSSSFILSVDKDFEPYKYKIKIELEVELDRFQDKVISNIEELNEYFDYHYCSNFIEYDYYAKRYYKMKEILDSGNKIFIGKLSSESDDEISRHLYFNDEVLKNSLKDEKIKFIDSGDIYD